MLWQFLCGVVSGGNSGRIATAALLVGTFLATPHAIIYDLPIVAAALALFIEARTESGGTFSLAEIIILILAYIFPTLMQVKDQPVSAVPLMLFFGVILWHARSVPARQPG